MSADDSAKRWETRRLRVNELAERHKPIAQALRFYAAILEFQAGVWSRCTSKLKPELPLRAQIEPSALVSEIRSLLSVVARHGTDLLRESAQQWQLSGEQRWCQALRLALEIDHATPANADDFFSRSCLQPVAENLQLQLQENSYTGTNRCPACGSLPQMAVLRPEGDAGARWLLCSLCLREWAFRRLICPWCQEEDKEKLPRFSLGDWPSVHVEACDTCRRYLKAVDMTVDGLAVPLVDETAFSVLDVWASDRRYVKIVPNLMGF